MTPATLAMLTLADATLPGGRNQLIDELLPLLAEKKYFSAETVARRYDVSLSCVKSWAAKRLLTPSFKIPGGTARYTLADLHAFEKLSGRKEAEDSRSEA